MFNLILALAAVVTASGAVYFAFTRDVWRTGMLIAASVLFTAALLLRQP